MAISANRIANWHDRSHSATTTLFWVGKTIAERARGGLVLNYLHYPEVEFLEFLLIGGHHFIETGFCREFH
jgi:hypothetical protein